MEIYKIISFLFVPFLYVMALILNKSISLGLARPSIAIFQAASLVGIAWGFFSIINLFGWWSLLAIPLVWGLCLYITGKFLHHLRTMGSGNTVGEELIIAQGGYGVFTLIFFVASLAPYLWYWFF
ncbi:TPA: hypothetical protein ACXENI_003920 [Acinetobacter baumannii]